MQAAQGYEDLLHATRAQLETSGQLQKWRQQQQEQQQQRQNSAPSMSAIARIEICGKCQGHRLEKVLYQSMVLERTCAQCNGEGVITKELPPPTTTTSGTRQSQKQTSRATGASVNSVQSA